MGKHWNPGRGKPGQGSFSPVARAVTAAGVLAASVAAVNLAATTEGPGLALRSVARAGAAPATATHAGTAGSETPGALDRAAQGPVEAATTGSDQVGAGTLATPVLSDPHAVLSFPHPAVGSFGDGGQRV